MKDHSLWPRPLFFTNPRSRTEEIKWSLFLCLFELQWNASTKVSKFVTRFSPTCISYKRRRAERVIKDRRYFVKTRVQHFSVVRYRLALSKKMNSCKKIISLLIRGTVKRMKRSICGCKDTCDNEIEALPSIEQSPSVRESVHSLKYRTWWSGCRTKADSSNSKFWLEVTGSKEKQA